MGRWSTGAITTGQSLQLNIKNFTEHLKSRVMKFFKNQKAKRTGEKIIAVVSFGGLNYVADIESAIDAGEIVSINSKSFSKENANVVVQENKGSVADELIKLKKLYDDSALTQEEYEVQKNKVQEKQ
jgi:hypothetical protein